MNKTKMLCFLSDLSKLMKEYEVEIDSAGTDYYGIGFSDCEGNGMRTARCSESINGNDIQRELNNHESIIWKGDIED